MFKKTVIQLFISGIDASLFSRYFFIVAVLNSGFKSLSSVAQGNTKLKKFRKHM